jgi:hypothetical protein
LDREGAFSPVLFELAAAEGNDSVVFRDEVGYRPWTEYKVEDEFDAKVLAYYSPWQLIYLRDAIGLTSVKLDAQWVLDDEKRQTIHDSFRHFWSVRLNAWRRLDADWRDILLVLLRLSSYYGPPIKGTLMKSTVTLVHHPETGDGDAEPIDVLRRLLRKVRPTLLPRVS